MNALENWYCSTSFWRWLTRKRLLPWLLRRADLGNHLLEIGAGPGAATAELRKRVPRVTSLEYDYAFASRLAQKVGNGAGVVQGDAAALPFADRTFAEVHRVLRPDGRFIAFEIQDGWLHRVIHTNSTFVPVPPAALAARLTTSGFTGVTVDYRPGGFRFRASREK